MSYGFSHVSRSKQLPTRFTTAIPLLLPDCRFKYRATPASFKNSRVVRSSFFALSNELGFFFFDHRWQFDFYPHTVKNSCVESDRTRVDCVRHGCVEALLCGLYFFNHLTPSNLVHPRAELHSLSTNSRVKCTER